jgi:50S ribosomal protein L16 3-hydroxylase
MPSDEPFSAEEVSELLGIHGIKRLGGLRAFYFEDTIEQGFFYINGEEYQVDIEIINIDKLLCNNIVVMPTELAPWCENDAFITLMIDMLNQGFWFWVES